MKTFIIDDCVYQMTERMYYLLCKLVEFGEIDKDTDDYLQWIVEHSKVDNKVVGIHDFKEYLRNKAG